MSGPCVARVAVTPPRSPDIHVGEVHGCSFQVCCPLYREGLIKWVKIPEPVFGGSERIGARISPLGRQYLTALDASK